jgi:hypothetical protein
MLEARALEDFATALGLATAQVTAQITAQVALVLRTASEARSREELQQSVALGDRKHFRETLLNPLLQANWLAPTLPEKPKSPRQKYRLTEAGRTWLAVLDSSHSL